MVLEINDLTVQYAPRRGREEEQDIRAVDDVSFDIEQGQSFGLVGESGCGKSTIAESILQVLPSNGSITNGSIKFKGKDLTQLSEEELNEVRWENIAWISQEAMDAFNPVYTVRDQIHETVRIHRDNVSAEEIDEKIKELFDVVGVDAERADDYPHQFSGGMKQRAMIALAMILKPDLIIADEPTTALDVINQDKVLYHLENIMEEAGASLMIITHDMSVVADMCDKVGVMYAGQLAEIGSSEDVFLNSTHPYTMGLKNAFPTVRGDEDDLVHIPGKPTTLRGEPEKCGFADRCPFAVRECTSVKPPLEEQKMDGEHKAACIRIDELTPERMRSEAAEKETWLQNDISLTDSPERTLQRGEQK